MRQKSHKAIQAILILSLLLTTAPSSTESLNQSLNFHFGDSGCGTCGWFVVVDGVMGGALNRVIQIHTRISETDWFDLLGQQRRLLINSNALRKIGPHGLQRGRDSLSIK